MMTKADYELISQEIDTVRQAYINYPATLESLHILTKNLAETFERVDRTFDYEQFVDDCGF